MQSEPNNTHQTVDHLFRVEAGRMVAVLVKLFGLPEVSLAQDIVQETLVTALESWKLKGLPDNPRAWLYQVAKNRALDQLRRQQRFQERVTPQWIAASESDAQRRLDDFFLDHEIEDAQLRMMFACCHPAIPGEAQLILMLRTLCGLSNAEIAAALLAQEDAVAKRLYRAKEKIRTARLALEVPAGPALAGRLDAVLQAIYLLFNEGYKSTSSDAVIRRDLAEEALRLGALLSGHPVGQAPKAKALMALMCYHAARFDARLDAEGQIVLLEHQDRSLWDRELIGVAYRYFTASFSGSEISEYHLEAAIASYHAQAPRFEDTNWKAIFYCYELLYKINGSPMVALNRAIARGYAEGPAAGIEALLKIAGLEHHYLYHTALGDFYRKTGASEKAQEAYQQAMRLAQLPAEQKVLRDKAMQFISEQPAHSPARSSDTQ